MVLKTIKSLKFIALLILSTTITYGKDWKCEDNISVRYYHSQKEILNQYSICHRDEYFEIVSQKVYKKRGVYFRDFRKKMSKVSFKRSQFGSPHFQKCILAGGDAKLVDIYLDNHWESSSLCFFEDGIFIGTHYLTTFE